MVDGQIICRPLQSQTGRTVYTPSEFGPDGTGPDPVRTGIIRLAVLLASKSPLQTPSKQEALSYLHHSSVIHHVACDVV